jgi:hypothetical protein
MNRRYVLKQRLHLEIVDMLHGSKTLFEFWAKIHRKLIKDLYLQVLRC